MVAQGVHQGVATLHPIASTIRATMMRAAGTGGVRMVRIFTGADSGGSNMAGTMFGVLRTV
jgi:hypothetical protein